MANRNVFSKLSGLAKINFLSTAIVNFRHFGLTGLRKMPVIIQYGVKFRCRSASAVIFKQPLQRGMLYINKGNSIKVEKGGQLIFTGLKATFNNKNIVDISAGGTVEIGNNFYANGLAGFNCRKKLQFGNDVLISVNVMFLDTDYHPIFDRDGLMVNPDREIIIGNNVWIGCNVTILKGTVINNNIIIAAGSVVTGRIEESNCIYAGNPVKVIKRDISWHI